MTRGEVVAEGIGVGEGPVWRAASRDLLVTSVAHGLLYLVDPWSGATRVFADTSGGPNSCVAADDGGAVVCQNKGIDMRPLGGAYADLPDPRWTTPCLQKVGADGTVTTLAGADIVQSPNDLVVAADGSILFTDPPHWPWADNTMGRVMRLRAPEAAPMGTAVQEDARLEILDQFEHYLNGIALSPDDRILTVEGNGVRWLDPDGGRPWLVEELGDGVGDGMAFDSDGHLYLCMPGVGLRVIDTDGSTLDQLELPADALTLNCCFGGDDLRTLFVTDAGHGTLLAFEHMPSAGNPVRAWPVSP